MVCKSRVTPTLNRVRLRFECIYVWIRIYKCVYISMCVCIYIYVCMYMYVYIYEVHTIILDFFVWPFKIVVNSWKFSMLLLYILWDDWPIFMISGSNEQLHLELEYTLLKLDCHSWWISKMQSDTLEEWYAIKFCFKLGKNASETYGMLQTDF